MARLVHDISLVLPETAAQEALVTVQSLVQQPQPETGGWGMLVNGS